MFSLKKKEALITIYLTSEIVNIDGSTAIEPYIQLSVVTNITF